MSNEDVQREPERRRRKPRPAEDVQEEPARRRRPRPVEDGPDDREYGYEKEPPYPPLVKAAGVIWIVYGCLILLNMAAVLLLTFVVAAQMNANAPAGAAGAAAGGGVCVSVVIGLIALAFLFVGVQSVKGTARDTLGNGVGSIGIGIILLIGPVIYVAMGMFVQAAVAGVGAGLLLTAGALALMGRRDYKAWRKWQKAEKDRETAERKARRRLRD